MSDVPRTPSESLRALRAKVRRWERIVARASWGEDHPDHPGRPTLRALAEEMHVAVDHCEDDYDRT